MNPVHASRLLGLFAATACVLAQTVTFPSDHTAIPDGSTSQNWFPYSYGISRMQAVYERWDLGIPAGRMITRIGFRADPNVVSFGRSLQLEVRMGRTNRDADTLDPTYAANWAATPTTVFGPALFTLPDLNNPMNPNPGGPNAWLNLTTPIAMPASGNLLVEWRILANNNGGASFPYELDVATFVSPIVQGVPGCPHSGNQVPTLQSQPVHVGGAWYDQLYGAPASQFALLVVNVNSPLTTPFPLSAFVPGISPSCQGQVAPGNLFTLGAFTDGGGGAWFTTAIPNDRLFNDTILATQAVCFDFFAPGGIVVSNAEQVQIGIDPASSVLWSQGDANATTGSVYYHWGPVTLFAHN
ncbi:MAG: hypothetical protein IPK26_26575 [Planctomycetes bacterium]|nr:hypothetical protein [Planctomycetota bacterium]